MAGLLRPALASAALVVGLSCAAHATTVTYSFSDNSHGEDAIGSLVDNGSIDILTVTNDLANPTSVAGEISGVVLTFSRTLTSASLPSQVSGTGDMIDVSNGKGTIFAGNPNNWTSSSSGKTLTLTTNHHDPISGSCAGGPPCDLIIGPGPYTNSNSSNTTHNPSVYEEAIFDLSGLTGLTLTGVYFEYGTTPADGPNLDIATTTTGGGGQLATPLPPTIALFAAGLGAIGLLGRRRKLRAAPLSV